MGMLMVGLVLVGVDGEVEVEVEGDSGGRCRISLGRSGVRLVHSVYLRRGGQIAVVRAPTPLRLRLDLGVAVTARGYVTGW